MVAVSSLARLQMYKSYYSDLTSKIQLASAAKIRLAESVGDLMNIGTDLEKDSPELKVLEQRQQRLELVEKKLEERVTRYQAQLQMVEAEIQNCQQMLQKGIQMTFGGH